MREQVERLEDDPDPLPDPVEVDALGGDLVALDEDPPGVDRLEQVDAAQERRFARARRADETDHLVLVDNQVDPAQDFERPERLVEALDPERFRHRAPPGAACRRSRATSQSTTWMSGIVTIRNTSASPTRGVKL